MSSPVFYVYGLIDPRNQQPFYIGKGKDKRALVHVALVRSGRRSTNKFKDAIISKILAAGLEPEVMFISENMDEETAYNLEASLIERLGRRCVNPNGLLSNICIGGIERLIIAGVYNLMKRNYVALKV